MTSLSALAGEGVVTVASTHSAKDTADKFVAIAQEKGLNVFARINHQENATKVDMTLRPTEVIVFGNPKVGTPLLYSSPTWTAWRSIYPTKSLVSADAAQANRQPAPRRSDVFNPSPITSKAAI
ncbi:DUF302 domain-containing protein, partial [Vibrio alginolyticus]|nr:DUF302 domain-containing protein [Vibrio alginolyticus]